MKSKITGRVEEWWKSICQKYDCKYYIHKNYPSCSYCTYPDNCIVIEKDQIESEIRGMAKKEDTSLHIRECLSSNDKNNENCCVNMHTEYKDPEKTIVNPDEFVPLKNMERR